MAKTTYEKALEKQQRENQKIAVQEARRQYASTIVSGQPVVSGMRIMDAASEEVFAALLKLYDGNENRYIQGDNSVFPAPYRSSIPSEFEKLSYVWNDFFYDFLVRRLGSHINPSRIILLR